VLAPSAEPEQTLGEQEVTVGDRAVACVRVVVVVLVAAVVGLVPAVTALTDDSAGEPVPSLDPVWSASFVPPPEPRLRAATRCVPVDVVFYAQTDWLRLAQMLRADPSPCAEYYVSIPPSLVSNPPDTPAKTGLRSGQAELIRALSVAGGPQFHAMAEINFAGWANWVAADPSRTWFDAGVEARARMAAAGYDVGDGVSGDIWAVNEFSSAVRTGSGSARQDVRDLVRGLYTGDGTTPAEGLVWVSGIGQPTTFLDTYKGNVKQWMGDGPFFADTSQYVRFFSQEVYASVSNWAVAGTTPQDRLGPLNDYLEHFGILAVVVDDGSEASVTVAVSPAQTCSISVNYKSGPSRAAGLYAQRALGSPGHGRSGRTPRWVVGRSSSRALAAGRFRRRSSSRRAASACVP
jgi:hypothetical protein